ncbi:hypothetical protein ABE66_07365 [Cytobacillus firmus]|nr:hypothetical protein [Cytobacillus firmus]
MGKVFRAGPVSLFGQYKGKSVRVIRSRANFGQEKRESGGKSLNNMDQLRTQEAGIQEKSVQI